MPAKRFGQIAVEMGFITAEQLSAALIAQAEENIENGTHQLIGQILVKQKLLSEEQVQIILETMNQQMISKISIGR